MTDMSVTMGCRVPLSVLLSEETYLAQPVVQQVLLVLRQHQQGELHAFVRVQLALGEQGPKVDQQGGGLAGDRRHRLEFVNGLLRAQYTLNRNRGQPGLVSSLCSR